MRHTDIAIVGAGLAGSTAAAMLGRANIPAVIVDPHPVYPADFRCEKLDGPQVEMLRKTGLADLVLPATTRDREVWIARFGRVIDRRPGDQCGILYQDLVNTMRAAIPPHVARIDAKALDISTGSGRQTLSLSNGEAISARLIVLACGLNVGLRHKIGIGRTVTSPCHSITVGFDFVPVGRGAFPFSAMTYYAERTSDRMAYLTLFPIGQTMRANLLVYRDMEDPWLQTMRSQPVEALRSLMPRLAQWTGPFDVAGPIRVRPADLYVTSGHRQAGVVLVGDAFATSCPAAGTGTGKVFTDVERLCNVHIPRWLASPGMGAGKIGAFYDDPVKVENDRLSEAKAYHVRALSLEDSLPWRARRWARFAARLGVGAMRSWREGFPRIPANGPAPAQADTRHAA